MATPCQGIALKPVRLADILVAAEPPVEKKYLRPSERAKNGPTPLTAVELASDMLFPSLASPTRRAVAGPAWDPVAPMSYKKNVEEGIKRVQQEMEEGQRREQITDPCQMTEEELQQNGWATLSLRTSPEWRRGFIERNEEKGVLVTEDGPLILTPEIVANPAKLKYYTQVTNSDGTPIEREKEQDFTEKVAPTHNPSSVRRAAERMWAFVGKKLA